MHLLAPGRVVGGVAMGGAGLVGEEVVVHREGLEGPAGHRDFLEGEVPDPVDPVGPDLASADGTGVVAEPQGLGGRDEVALPLQAGGPAADERLAVVEGQRLPALETGVGLPVPDERLGLADLALPLLGRPGSYAPVRPAEVAVEVGADLVAVAPGPAELFRGVLDSLEVVEADVGGSGRVLRRAVEVLLGPGQQIDAAEEVRHRRVVLLAHLAEVGEQPLLVLAGAVPREDDELRGLFAGLQPPRRGLVGLGPGVGGRAVADQPGRAGGGLGGGRSLAWRVVLGTRVSRAADRPRGQRCCHQNPHCGSPRCRHRFTSSFVRSVEQREQKSHI